MEEYYEKLCKKLHRITEEYVGVKINYKKFKSNLQDTIYLYYDYSDIFTILDDYLIDDKIIYNLYLNELKENKYYSYDDTVLDFFERMTPSEYEKEFKTITRKDKLKTLLCKNT